MEIEKQRLLAFSIQEMVVVLLITVIVVGMSFSVLRMVQRQMNSIEDIYEVRTEVNHLRQSLWIDFNRYSTILYDAENQKIRLINEIHAKEYRIEQNLIVSEKDTFHIKLDELKFYFDNQEINQGEIDAMELRTDKNLGGQNIFVFKTNTPSTYLNL